MSKINILIQCFYVFVNTNNLTIQSPYCFQILKEIRWSVILHINLKFFNFRMIFFFLTLTQFIILRKYLENVLSLLNQYLIGTVLFWIPWNTYEYFDNLPNNQLNSQIALTLNKIGLLFRGTFQFLDSDRFHSFALSQDFA